MPSFGENLRALRKSRGYTQERFARVIDSNQTTVASWENGSRTPNLETVRHIADMFKVPVSSLLSLEDTGMEADGVVEISDAIRRDPMIRKLFDYVRYMSHDDLDVMIHVASALSKRRTYE